MRLKVDAREKVCGLISEMVKSGKIFQPENLWLDALPTRTNKSPRSWKSSLYLAAVNSGSMSMYHQRKVGGNVGFTHMCPIQKRT